MKRSPLCLFSLIAFCLYTTSVVLAQNIDIPGPAGSGSFGSRVVNLPNGNIVIADPDFDSGALTDVGAVHLYNGVTGQLISTMTGTTAGDHVGSGGIGTLIDGDFYVLSPAWHNGAVSDASAMTRCSRDSGCPTSVGTTNSLVGSKSGDFIGGVQVVVLSNGNYLVVSPYWDNGFSPNAGAVTFCLKSTGCPLGPITASNSLVGNNTNDLIGSNGIITLSNGNFLVNSPNWKIVVGPPGGFGAVTFGKGTIGVTGSVSGSNSLVGTRSGDRVGTGGVFALPSGNYVVSSPLFRNNGVIDSGATTFGNGTTGVVGVITSSNSLVGIGQAENVGSGGITVLTNGNYVIATPFWSNDPAHDIGAVTWASGVTGITGTITPANSLTGSTSGDTVGNKGVRALANGNYVVASSNWSNGSQNVTLGAATWGNGSTGTNGVVSVANSIVGSVGPDSVAESIVALPNGNYLVCSPHWSLGPITQVGAVTWGNGSGGSAGAVSSANSLVGSVGSDHVGINGVAVLPSGNYVVLSFDFHNNGALHAGAVTWGNGATGISGPVSAANSLVGTVLNDQVGSGGVAILANGNYVVSSPSWDNVSAVDAGAATWVNGTSGLSGIISSGNSLVGTASGESVASSGITGLANGSYVVASPNWSDHTGAATWANGSTGIKGEISSSNSLVGTNPNDNVGSYGVSSLANSIYIVRSPLWDNANIDAAGAVTRGNGSIGLRGLINSTNSVLGTTANGGTAQSFVFDPENNQFIVGRPADNLVTLWRAAATASIAGRVTEANGAPIANATVSLVGPGGEVRTTQTGSLGYFLLDGVPTWATYNVFVSAKRHRFDPVQALFVDSNISELNVSAR